MRKWQLQEAKARLSEVIRQAAEEGPQSITLHGHPAAVVISSEGYRKLRQTEERFVDFMRRSPLYGVEIDLEREQTPTRGVDFS